MATSAPPDTRHLDRASDVFGISIQAKAKKLKDWTKELRGLEKARHVATHTPPGHPTETTPHVEQLPMLRSLMDNNAPLNTYNSKIGHDCDNHYGQHCWTPLQEAISRKHNLVDRQDAVFNEFTNHIRSNITGQQILIYTGGAAGTGKTRIVKAIKDYFQESHIKHRLKVGAYTACASIIIGGSTLHSLIGLLLDTSADFSTIKPSNHNWANVDHLIIDEVSMIGCNMLGTIHLKLQMLKASIAPFGGIHILFMGDFIQFPPISDAPLYSRNIQPAFNFTQRTQKKVVGKSLWENCVHPKTTNLTQQLRQAEDPQYSALLNNIRDQKFTTEDFRLLSTPFQSHLKLNLLEPPWITATYIVPRKDLKTAINHYMVEHHLRKSGMPSLTVVATDTYKGQPLQEDIQMLVRHTVSLKQSHNLLPFLKLFKGMRVMLTENIHQKLGLVNGAVGEVVNVFVDNPRPQPSNNMVSPTQVLVDFSEFVRAQDTLSDIQLLHLPTNVVSISPVTKLMMYKHETSKFRHKKTFKIKRLQLPLTPAYNLTNYKAQRQTYDHLIIDLKNPPDGHPISIHNIYVTLSRLCSLQGLVILCDITFEQMKRSKFNKGVIEYISTNRPPCFPPAQQQLCPSTYEHRASSPSSSTAEPTGPTNSKDNNDIRESAQKLQGHSVDLQCSPQTGHALPPNIQHVSSASLTHGFQPRPFTQFLEDYLWIPEHHLTRAHERTLLDPSGWLGEEHMNAALNILYNTTLREQGYQQQRYATLCARSKYKSKCLQQIFINNNHWALVLLRPGHLECHCVLYNSNMPHNDTLPGTTFQNLQQLMPGPRFQYKYADVHQQNDASSCGVFTIAYATDIAAAINPELSTYTTPLDMRRHFHICLNNACMVPFPKTSQFT